MVRGSPCLAASSVGWMWSERFRRRRRDQPDLMAASRSLPRSESSRLRDESELLPAMSTVHCPRSAWTRPPSAPAVPTEYSVIVEAVAVADHSRERRNRAEYRFAVTCAHQDVVGNERDSRRSGLLAVQGMPHPGGQSVTHVSGIKCHPAQEGHREFHRFRHGPMPVRSAPPLCTPFGVPRRRPRRPRNLPVAVSMSINPWAV